MCKKRKRKPHTKVSETLGKSPLFKGQRLPGENSYWPAIATASFLHTRFYSESVKLDGPFHIIDYYHVYIHIYV